MRVTVLGSGTLLPNDRRRSAAHLVECGEAQILLDCGSGTLHGFDRHRVAWRRITHVAFSHFHTDHVGDLAPLLFALKHGARPEREEPLVLLGPAGLANLVRHLAAAHGAFVTDPGFPVEVVELSRETAWEAAGGGFVLRTYPTPHTDVSVAYRLEAVDGAVGYTGDTGPSHGLAEFMSGVAALVSECGVADPTEVTTHLSPTGVASLALGARPGLLVLTHLYPPLRPHQVPDLVREAGYDGPMIVARDGTKVHVEDGRAELEEG